MHVFKIWLRRTLNGFLLSGCPGCRLGEENKKLYWTLWVAVSVVKIKALSRKIMLRGTDSFLWIISCFHIKFMPWIPLEWSSCAYLRFLSVLPKTFVKYKSSRFLYHRLVAFWALASPGRGEMNAWQTNPKGRLRGGYLSPSSLFLKKGFRLF